MDDVKFEEKVNEYVPTHVRTEPKKIDLTNTLVRKGIVKNQKSAETVLIIVAVLFFGLAAWNFITHTHAARPTDEAAKLHPENQVVHTLPNGS